VKLFIFIIDFFVDEFVIWEYRINCQKYFTLLTLKATFLAACESVVSLRHIQYHLKEQVKVSIFSFTTVHDTNTRNCNDV
jgi:hypothetical protein